MALPASLKNLSVPVIGSPLFIVSNPDLVIAQCKAGIVGSFPALNARPAPVFEEWLIRITNAESYRMPEIGRYTYGKGHQLIADYLRGLFERRLAAAAGPARDMEDLVTAFLNLMSGPARLNAWGLDAQPVDVELFVRKRVRLFLRGALCQ